LPPTSDAQLQSLRLKYNVAYTAYRSLVKAVTEAAMEGKTRSAETVEHEAKALFELNEARAKLLAAMADRYTAPDDASRDPHSIRALELDGHGVE